MFTFIFGLPWLLVVVRYILPLPWPWSVKAILAGVLLIASQYHLFSRLSSGSIFSPEFPRPLIIAFNVLFGSIILLAVFQIALDAICIALTLVEGHLSYFPPAVRYAMGI